MPRVCAITGKRTASGNNVSHANNKLRRKFRVNLARKRIWVPSKKRYVSMMVSSKGLRILDKKGADAVLADLGLV